MQFRVVRILIGCIGSVIFLWFFVPGLLTGHLHIGVVTGTVIGLILTIYAIFFSQINRFLKFLWRHVAGRVIICVVSAAILAILILAIMCMICMGSGMRRGRTQENSMKGGNMAAEQDIAMSDSQDGQPAGHTVVVLGCRVYSYGPSLMLRSRLDAAYECLTASPESVCIVCGGQGSNEPEAEADVMYDYLTGRGIDPARIYKDDTSEDTNGNLINAAEIISANDLNPLCTIVTSDYHCYRALQYAEQLGYEDPAALPAGTLWWLFPSAYVREMYGILEMWFLK